MLAPRVDPASEGVTEYQAPPREHPGLAIADTQWRHWHAENHPARRHAHHQPELVLERPWADARGVPRGRVEIHIEDRIGGDLQRARMPGQVEVAAQLDAIAQPRERFFRQITVVMRGGVGERRAPQAEGSERVEAVVAAQPGAVDDGVNFGRRSDRPARLDVGIEVPSIGDPIVELDTRLEAERTDRARQLQMQQVLRVEIEETDGEGKDEPDAWPAAVRLRVAEYVARLERVHRDGAARDLIDTGADFAREGEVGELGIGGASRSGGGRAGAAGTHER